MSPTCQKITCSPFTAQHSEPTRFMAVNRFLENPKDVLTNFGSPMHSSFPSVAFYKIDCFLKLYAQTLRAESIFFWYIRLLSEVWLAVTESKFSRALHLKVKQKEKDILKSICRRLTQITLLCSTTCVYRR